MTRCSAMWTRCSTWNTWMSPLASQTSKMVTISRKRRHRMNVACVTWPTRHQSQSILNTRAVRNVSFATICWSAGCRSCCNRRIVCYRTNRSSKCHAWTNVHTIRAVILLCVARRRSFSFRSKCLGTKWSRKTTTAWCSASWPVRRMRKNPGPFCWAAMANTICGIILWPKICRLALCSRRWASLLIRRSCSSLARMSRRRIALGHRYWMCSAIR